ncbi:MAG TPA: ferritin family protein [Burkholderiales bacterium]|nr:ferritin family protein [Burkholderiales bacterium]
MKAIRSPAELYAHAIAIEREAAGRYSELAERMDDEGREELARVFGELARMEAEHLETLERRTQGIALPAIAPGEYQWLGEAPETAARDLVFRLMTPRQALAMALAAEQRAEAFFEHLCWSAPDPALRSLAREMAAEESGHVALIARLLEATPAPLEGTLLFERD